MSLVELIQSCKPVFTDSLVDNMYLGNCRDKNSIVANICENYVKSWIEESLCFDRTYSAKDFSHIPNLDISDSGPCGIEIKNLSACSVGELDYFGVAQGETISVEVKSGRGKFSTIRKVNSYFDKKYDLTKLLLPDDEFKLFLFIPVDNLKTVDPDAFDFLSNYEHSSGKRINLVDLGNNSVAFEELYQLYKSKYLQ
jgi:hypothetical protein